MSLAPFRTLSGSVVFVKSDDRIGDLFAATGTLLCRQRTLATPKRPKMSELLNEGPATSGTMHIPAFEIPLSSYLSDIAKDAFLKAIAMNGALSESDLTLENIKNAREVYDKLVISPWLKKINVLYSTKIEERSLGGVNTYVVTPENAREDDERILINLHGGSFTFGAGMGQLTESIPIAGTSGIKVISIDYRQGPEHKFPAASEDVAAVYRELIKVYKPENIGIYGCSAGGELTAMAIAWLQEEQLPMPGAIGIFCGTADAAWGGESRYTVPSLMGQQPPPPTPNPPAFPMAYLSNADFGDALVSPIVSPALLAKFPPTLVITGTRAFELSTAVYTHTQLTKAGVEAELHVWEGMWHGFIYNPDLPESREAYNVIKKFFQKRL